MGRRCCCPSPLAGCEASCELGTDGQGPWRPHPCLSGLLYAAKNRHGKRSGKVCSTAEARCISAISCSRPFIFSTTQRRAMMRWRRVCVGAGTLSLTPLLRYDGPMEPALSPTLLTHALPTPCSGMWVTAPCWPGAGVGAWSRALTAVTRPGVTPSSDAGAHVTRALWGGRHVGRPAGRQRRPTWWGWDCPT